MKSVILRLMERRDLGIAMEDYKHSDVGVWDSDAVSLRHYITVMKHESSIKRLRPYFLVVPHSCITPSPRSMAKIIPSVKMMILREQ